MNEFVQELRDDAIRTGASPLMIDAIDKLASLEDQEERILELEAEVEDLEADIEELKERLDKTDQ